MCLAPSEKRRPNLGTTDDKKNSLDVRLKKPDVLPRGVEWKNRSTILASKCLSVHGLDTHVRSKYRLRV